MVKAGIFRPAEPRIGKRAAEADDQNEEREELRMPDRPAGKVEPAHQSPARLSTTCTFSPASSLWTPSATIFAPSGNARADEGPIGVVAGQRDARRAQRRGTGSTTQTLGPCPASNTAEIGMRAALAASASKRNGDAHAEAHAHRRVDERKARRVGAGRRVGRRRELAQFRRHGNSGQSPEFDPRRLDARALDERLGNRDGRLPLIRMRETNNRRADRDDLARLPPRPR